MNTFTFQRHRRLRSSDAMRALVQETHLHNEDLIYPIFVREGEQQRRPVDSMPGVYQLSLAHLEEEMREVVQLGIRSVIIFGIPNKKDEAGTLYLSYQIGCPL